MGLADEWFRKVLVWVVSPVQGVAILGIVDYWHAAAEWNRLRTGHWI